MEEEEEKEDGCDENGVFMSALRRLGLGGRELEDE